MAQFGKQEKELKDYEGSGNDYLNKSGMYEDVTIKRVIFDEAENGGAVVNLFVEYNGIDQMIYGDIRVFNKGGVNNDIGQKTLNELAVIVGLDGIETLGDVEEMELPIGKGKALKPVVVYDSIVDEVVTIKITNKYGVFNNNITEKHTISKFYRNDDKATVPEINVGDEGKFGTKYAKDLEYADNVKYSDGTDEAQVQAWIKEKRPKGTGKAATPRKPITFQNPRTGFGKKV